MNLNDFYISALFHDIGKLIERTKRYKDLKDNSRWSDKETRYIHPIYGAEWFRIASEHIPYFEGRDEKELKEIETLIATHHKPTGTEGKLLQIADWLSSSEREEDEEQKGIPYNRVPLSTIFSTISKNRTNYVYIPKALDFKTIFPSKSEESVDFGILEKDFESNLKNIDTLDKFLPLLERYTWCVPAQTVGYTPDISLYDHLATTAAFAVALWHERESGRLTEKDIDINSDKLHFCLLGGDVSGIQDFIFNIPSKGAAKSLKGRSLYISLLSEAISRYIVRELKLQDVNIVYIGGGNFHILIPYSSAEKVEELREKVSSTLLEGHGNRLYMALECAPISFREIKEGRLKEIYAKLYSSINTRKNRRYTELFHNYKLLFPEPSGLFPYEEHCKVCGENRKKHMRDEEICKMCNSFIELANDVKNAEFLSIKDVKSPDESMFEYKDIFKRFQFDIEFTQKPVEEARNYNLFEFDLSVNGIKAGAYRVPDKTFEEIVNTKNTGAKLLGYLKIDVDNLGQIFREKVSQSFSKRATLSRMLKLFFTAYVPHKLQDEDDIYLLYAGGDDAFIIGRWEKILEKADTLRQDFRNFVAESKEFTFSAGVTLHKHDFPVIRAANIVEEELENAKSSGKNRISIFHQAFSWEEFKDLLKLSEELCSWAYKIRKKSFILKLQSLSYNLKPLSKDRNHIGKPWQFIYALRDLNREKVKKILNIVKAMWLQEGAVDVSEYHIENRAFLYVASRIAELKLREVDFNELQTGKPAEEFPR